MKRSRILGIDPGTNFLGFAILEALPKELFLVDMGVLSLRKYSSHGEKLHQIFNRIQGLIDEFTPF